jgi:hypothetical protein
MSSSSENILLRAIGTAHNHHEAYENEVHTTIRRIKTYLSDLYDYNYCLDAEKWAEFDIEKLIKMTLELYGSLQKLSESKFMLALAQQGVKDFAELEQEKDQ